MSLTSWIIYTLRSYWILTTATATAAVGCFTLAERALTASEIGKRKNWDRAGGLHGSGVASSISLDLGSR